MKQFLSTIKKNKIVAEGYNLLEFEWLTDEVPTPGQFVTLRNRVSTDPLLRRPFAISAFDSKRDVSQIIYQIRGKGTQALAASQADDRIDVVGPLGKGFPPPQSGKTAYLIGGGIGFGPIYYFSNWLAGLGARPVAIIGARTAALIPDVPYPRTPDGTDIFRFCTDDGSTGFAGTVIDMLASFKGRTLTPETAEVYACGPQAMLAAIAEFTETTGITCWVSMEQIMGCGVGACMGCAIRAREPGKYVRVCTEGPVFNARELHWK